MNQEILEVGTDFTGIGSVDQALELLGIKSKKIFACDMDKFVRKAYVANYGRPDNYPKDVYNREIPEKPLGIYVTSPPCQAFSMSGKRQGEDDERGILFYNSLEFIEKNRPRFFIFENVKGLLSHDKDKNDKTAVYGKTFNKWIQHLGGKSVNGNPVIFPFEGSVPYHLYFKVLSATDYGIPQSRERIFLVGIRDDADNNFSFPKPVPLLKRLVDVLEVDVPEKYFLSKKMLKYLLNSNQKQKDAGNVFRFAPLNGEDIAHTVRTKAGERMEDNFVLINSATKCGYEIATPEDSINFSVLSSETRRGRVGKGVAQTLDTACNQAVLVSKEVRTEESKATRRQTGTNDFRGKKIEFRESEVMNTIQTAPTNDQLIATERIIISGNLSGEHWEKHHEQSRRVYDPKGISPTVHTMSGGGQHIKILDKVYRIRKLTPRECLRLMGFPDSFKIVVSDAQCYKQAGNSIVVHKMAAVINKLLN